MERVRGKADRLNQIAAGRQAESPRLATGIQSQNQGVGHASLREDAPRILVVDPCSLGAIGIAVILKSRWKKAEIHHTRFAREAESLLVEQTWDLVLVEMDLADRTGLDLIIWAKTTSSELRLLAMSSGDESVRGVQALRAGSAGFLNRSGSEEDLIKAVEQVLGGRHFISKRLVDTLARRMDGPRPNSGELGGVLSVRESEVFRALAEGEGIKQIGSRLKISPKTVSTYRRRILEKMHFRNDADIVKYQWASACAALRP